MVSGQDSVCLAIESSIMTDAQVNEFHARVKRIEKSERKSKQAFRRDSYGNIIATRKSKKGFRPMAVFKSLLMLYIAFVVFKAVLIHNSDGDDYAKMIANLEAGDAKSQFLAIAMAPDYFTEPVGALVANLALRVEELR